MSGTRVRLAGPDALGESLLIALVLLAPLPLGSVNSTAVAALSAGAAVLGALVLARHSAFPEGQGRFGWLAPVGFAATLVTLVPLPAALVRVVSPNAAALRLTVPLAAPPTAFPLSLHADATLTLLARIAVFCVVFQAAAILGRNPGSRLRIVGAVVVSGLLQAVYGAFEYLSGRQEILGGAKQAYVVDATGSYINKNHFAGLLEMSLPIGLALMLGSARERPAPSEGPPAPARPRRLAAWARSPEGGRALALGVAVAMLGAGLLLSHSRAGLLAAAGASAWVAWRLTREGPIARRRALLAAAGAMLLGLVLLAGPERALLGPQRWAAGLSATQGRLRVWLDAIGIAVRFPLVGSGLGTFRDVYPLWRTEPGGFVFDHAHNDLLELGVETGLVGLAIAAALIRALWRLAARGLRRAPPNQQAALVGAAGAVGALLAHELVDFNLHIPANALVFAATAGVLAGGCKAVAGSIALVAPASGVGSGRPRGVGRARALGIVWVAIAGLGVARAWQYDRSVRALVAADAAAGGRAARIALLRSAAEIGGVEARARARLAIELASDTLSASTRAPGAAAGARSEAVGARSETAGARSEAPAGPRAPDGPARRAPPSPREGRDRLAGALSAEGEQEGLPAAFEEVRRALRANPLDREAWLAGFRIAAAGAALGEDGFGSDLAERCMAGALRSDPASAVFRRRIASALLAAGDVEGATARLREALAAHAEDVEEMTIRMLDEGMPAGRIVSALPADSPALFAVGIRLLERGYGPEAEHVFILATEANPARPGPWAYLSRKAAREGRHEVSLDWAVRGAAGVPAGDAAGRAELLFCAALAREAMGDRAGAISDARVALQGAPTDAALRDTHARLLLASGDAEGAAAEWRYILERLPASRWLEGREQAVRVRLAGALEGAGRREEALAVFQAALAADPLDSAARDAVARLSGAR